MKLWFGATEIALDRRGGPFDQMIRRAMHLYWRFSRGMTLGVRGMALDSDGRIFLIKHSYIPGWHLPGGGVEPGETMLEALRREMMEEGNIAVGAAPEFFALYFNQRASDRDHVGLYVVRDFTQDSPPKPNAEIVAHGFFTRDALPPDTGPATRARIAEVLDRTRPSPLW
ncbi:NUDIX domain-containing protein [Pseudorhodoplanes sp.]|uniref:NUDIX domain-containing protein n=1 Tax=Pseudorhodoplanes sp. TaxID=1934341 RepID=UPI002BCB2769|nr:NUDIX domain-containing protein [Pseudorhodoplanes sp.]HWV43484.1 NUDIX domain-containing protein [Pseudorhodoplanes sp.]